MSVHLRWVFLGISYQNLYGSGRVHLILGLTIVVSTTITMSETDDRFQRYSDVQLGIQVSSAGDVDADGVDDVMVTAVGSDDAGQYLGAVYLFSGASLPYLASDNEIDPEAADDKIVGQTGV